jgi:hypothetical protein
VIVDSWAMLAVLLGEEGVQFCADTIERAVDPQMSRFLRVVSGVGHRRPQA